MIKFQRNGPRVLCKPFSKCSKKGLSGTQHQKLAKTNSKISWQPSVFSGNVLTGAFGSYTLETAFCCQKPVQNLIKSSLCGEVQVELCGNCSAVLNNGNAKLYLQKVVLQYLTKTEHIFYHKTQQSHFMEFVTPILRSNQDVFHQANGLVKVAIQTMKYYSFPGGNELSSKEKAQSKYKLSCKGSQSEKDTYCMIPTIQERQN